MKWTDMEEDVMRFAVCRYYATRCSVYSIVKRIQALMPYRSFSSIRQKLNRYRFMEAEREAA